MREAGVELPLMVSGTIEPMGTMLAGQGVEALSVALEHLDLISIGLNCATGPEFMTDHLRSLAAMSIRFVSVYPNAGLPDERGQYAETPASLAFKMKRFVDEGWVNFVGGCCGTTPAHIRALKTLVSGRPPPLRRQVHRQLDQSRGRRGAVREGRAPAPDLRRRRRRRLYRRGQTPGYGRHAPAQARDRRTQLRPPHPQVRRAGARPDLR